MSEAINEPIQLTVGSGRVDATWMNGTGIWVSEYYPHADTEIENYQFARRWVDLGNRFIRSNLFDPSVELIDGFVDDEEQDGGSQLLRISTTLIPIVDERMLRPIVELRQPPPTMQQVERYLVERDLRLGGAAIYNAFGVAMTPASTNRPRSV